MLLPEVLRPGAQRVLRLQRTTELAGQRIPRCVSTWRMGKEAAPMQLSLHTVDTVLSTSRKQTHCHALLSRFSVRRRSLLTPWTAPLRSEKPRACTTPPPLQELNPRGITEKPLFAFGCLGLGKHTMGMFTWTGGNRVSDINTGIARGFQQNSRYH